MISPIGALSFPTAPLPLSATPSPDVSGAASVGTPANVPGATGGGFADILTGQIDQLNSVQGNADSLALQASTGDLQDAHDYMIASSEARLATDTVVTLKNSAIAAFTEIMRMPV